MIQYKNTFVTVFESALFRTLATIVVTPDLVLLCDPNWLPAEVAAIRDQVDRIRDQRPLYLFVTHSDYDHILGCGAFPEATTIASRALAANPDAEKAVAEAQRFDDEYYIERPYRIFYPRVDLEIDTDDWSLSVGNTRLRGWTAPGHHRDGSFLLLDPGGIFLAGDYLSNVEFPFVYFSSTEYLATLSKAEAILEKYRPSLLIPGHGDVTDDPGLMKARLRKDREYLTVLQECIRLGRPFPEEAWLKEYPFPKGLRMEHERNVEFLKKEQLQEGGS